MPLSRATNKEDGSFEWVTAEWKDKEGNLKLPKQALIETLGHKFENKYQKEINPIVLRGKYNPPLLLVERKVYEIENILLQGWKRKGIIIIEMADWRIHEKEWFEAMKGSKLEIHNIDEPHEKDSSYKILKTSFERKIFTLYENNMPVELYEGQLEIAESFKSTYSNHKKAILKTIIASIIIPLLVAAMKVAFF